MRGASSIALYWRRRTFVLLGLREDEALYIHLNVMSWDLFFTLEVHDLIPITPLARYSTLYNPVVEKWCNPL